MNMDFAGNGRHQGFESHQESYRAKANGNQNHSLKANGNPPNIAKTTGSNGKPQEAGTNGNGPSLNPVIRETRGRFEVDPPETHPSVTDEEIDQLLEDAPRPTSGIFESLTHLRNAKNTAIKCDQNPELFAVGLNELMDRGLVRYQLQWLTHNGLIARCLSLPSNVETVFEANGISRAEDSYILSENGERLLDKLNLKMLQERRSNLNSNPKISGKPIYNAEKHLLIFAEQVVKRFRWAASNQERVLMAFEEEDWPRRIDDPLLPDPNICPKRRLHDTIKCLNRRQENKLVRFRGDGTGTGVLWELWDQEEDAS